MSFLTSDTIKILSFLFTIVIGILTFLSAFLPSTGKVYNDSLYIRQRIKLYKRITRRGWVTIGCSFGVVIFTVLQLYLNEVDSNIREKIASKKDSLSRAELKSYSLQTIDTIAQALGRYGYKLDSTANLVKILGDSAKKSKTQIILANKPIPILEMCLISKIEPDVEKDNKFENVFIYNLRVCSKNTDSKIIDIESHIILVDTLGNLKYLIRNDFLPKNAIVTKFESFGTNPSYYERDFYLLKKYSHKAIIVLLRGKYSDIDGDNIRQIEEVSMYNTEIIGNDRNIGYGRIGDERMKKSLIDFVDKYKEKK